MQTQTQRHRQRRDAAATAMGAESLGIWMSPPQIEQRPDVMVPFLPHPGLLYLTGCSEPESVLVLRSHSGQQHSALFIRPKDTLQRGLTELGILPANGCDDGPQLRDYFPHRIGHWLGLDVHDPGDYIEADGRSRQLQPGMCLTVEPGLYIPTDDESAPAEYRGIGVRLEDAVLITDGEPEVLTAACPKQRRDLETSPATQPTERSSA